MTAYDTRPTIGSLFAGIGGLDLGFERAGWRTEWQVEINPVNRAVLADRFPGAERFCDVREAGRDHLLPVDCIAAGFPCQDFSNAGHRPGEKRPGLKGKKSSLFFEVLRILDEIQPEWVVLENVASMVSHGQGASLQKVVRSLAERGYLGCFRVLDSRYFGVPQKRRRVFVVGRLGKEPPMELFFDASPMGPISGPLDPREGVEGHLWPAPTLQAINANSRLGLSNQLLVTEEDGWGEMVERSRKSQDHGLCLGLDEANLAESFAAGNAICPQVAEWIGNIIRSEIQTTRKEAA
ncbi:MAG: DNA cytosine methyltransferase [Verrucomicrobiota bacterium]